MIIIPAAFDKIAVFNKRIDFLLYLCCFTEQALKETVKLQKVEIEKLRMEKSRLTFEIKRLKNEQQNDLDYSLIEKL